MSRRRPARIDQGFTLVELLIAIVVLGMITGAVAAGIAGAFRNSTTLNQKTRETVDASLVSAFLTRDAQAAGGINPGTGTTDATLGVSTSSPAGCVAVGTPVIAFRWRDRSPGAPTNTGVLTSAVYGFNSSTGVLTRTQCAGSATSDVRLTGSVASVTASCPGGCTGTPATVTLTLVATNNPNNSPTPFTTTLTAEVRPDTKGSITGNPSTQPISPLMAIGSTSCVTVAGGSTTGLYIAGTTNVTVNGIVYVNAANAPGCTAMTATGSSSFAASATQVFGTGTCSGSRCPATTSYGTRYVDPFAGYAERCTSGSNPSNPLTPGADGVLVVPQDYSFPVGPMALPTGLYVFCGNVSLGGNVNLSGSGAILYVPNGTFSLAGNGNTLNVRAIIARTVSMSGTSSVTLGAQPPVVTSTAISGVRNVPMSTQLSASPTSGAYSWSATGLPPWLSLSAGGLLTGTPPSTGGPFTFSVIATDTTTFASSVPTTVTLTVNAGLTITTPSLAWTVGSTITGLSIATTGGTGVFTWTVTGLPTGVTFDPLSNGAALALAGTPTTTGPANVAISVIDGAGQVATATITFTVNATPSVGPLTLPAWTANRPNYPGPTATSTGGTGGITWSISGMPGLTISAGGAISGTPTQVGAGQTVTVTATDATGASGSVLAAVTINAFPSIGAFTLAPWTVGQPSYPGPTVSAAGGTGSFTWSIAGPGLTIASVGAASAAIAGAPTPAGAGQTVTVTATDSTGATTSRTATITVNPLPAVVPSTLASTTSGASSSRSLTATGGTGTLIWSSPNLPSWLTLTGSNLTASLVGVAPSVSVATDYTFSLRVTDRDGAGVASPLQSFTITVQPAPVVAAATLSETTSAMTSRSWQVSASGGIGNLVWSSPDLPAWLTLTGSSNGQTATLAAAVVPTVTTRTQYTFRLRVTDQGGSGGPSALRTFSIFVNPAIIITGPSSLPAGREQTNYPAPPATASDVTFSTAAGTGTGVITWSAAGLPQNMTIDANTGIISGRPRNRSAGTYNVTITATDAAGATASVTRALVIN